MVKVSGVNEQQTRAESDYLYYREMLLIRRVEESILRLFSEGKVSGTTHTCIGQEANCVGVIAQLDSDKDYVISNHRNHGHFLAFGGSANGLLAEVMGHPKGTSGGMGGSQHIKSGRFLSSGVQGGGTPIGCGLAMGEKLSGTDGIVVVCIGDGTLGEGVLYESLNMASLWSLPILFLVENNQYAQSTPVELGVAGSITDRAAPFGIETSDISSTDIREIRAWGTEAINYVRSNRKPLWGVIHTYRLAAHSKGDDDRSFEEIEQHKKQDPLLIQGARLTADEKRNAEEWVENILIDALASIDVVEPSANLERLRI